MQQLAVCCSDYLLMYYLINRRCLIDPLLVMMVFSESHRLAHEGVSTTLHVHVLSFSPLKVKKFEFKSRLDIIS